MKRILLTTICVFAFLHNSYSQKIEIEGITYKINNEEAYVHSASSKIENAIIVSSVNYKGKDYPVTRVGKGTPFKGGSLPFDGSSSLKTVSIPNSVNEICFAAFRDCINLKEIILPDNPITVYTTLNSKGNLNIMSAFRNCISVLNVRCQNGSIPTYILGSLPENCPFILSMKFHQPNNNISQVPVQQALIQNTPNDIATKKTRKPSSDVDVNIPSNQVINKKTFAVIFANEKYQEEVDVEYAENDGEVFKEYCQKVLGLPEDNIHLRKNATKNNMIAEISWMKKVAEAYKGQSKFIVYYAGHGIPDEKSGSAYLLPVDGMGTEPETAYSLALFYKILSGLPASSVTIFMDACFSGAKRGDGMLASARGIAIRAKTQEPEGKMVVFTAAQGDETAYPFKEKEHGLFTYYLLKKLKETKGNVTYSELAKYIQEEVHKKSIVANKKSQTPSVIPSNTIVNQWKTMKLK